MISVIQRASQASLEIDGRTPPHASFQGPGLVVLAGLEETDTPDDTAWAAEKIVHLRIFADQAGKMNLSVIDAGGSILLVPNFTLAGDAAKGRRPSFDRAMRPERAEPMFSEFVAKVRALWPRTEQGVFGRTCS